MHGQRGGARLVRLHDVSAVAAGYTIAASSLGWSAMAILIAGADGRHDRGPTLI